MSQVFLSDGTGAGVYVFADDHCPPHVHARHRSEGWIARVQFSYLSQAVELMSIAPAKNIPLQRAVNLLLDEIQAELPHCRRRWWIARRTTCLENQWVLASPTGTIVPLLKRRADAKQIAAAIYDPASGRLAVTFQDGATEQVQEKRS